MSYMARQELPPCTLSATRPFIYPSSGHSLGAGQPPALWQLLQGTTGSPRAAGNRRITKQTYNLMSVGELVL